MQFNRWVRAVVLSSLALGIALGSAPRAARAESPAATPAEPAAEGSTTDPTAAPAPKKHAVRLSISYLNTFMNPFPGYSTSGLGPSAVYEFIWSPHFTFGIQMGYRWFMSNPGFTWFGYGFLMKDYFTKEQPFPGVRPYFEYGLLLASIRAAGRTSYAIAHDTRLSLGMDIGFSAKFPLLLFFDATYHLSWLGYFNTDSINLMAAEFNLGVRYVF